MTCILYASFYKYAISIKTFLMLDMKVQLLKGRVVKTDPDCVVNCKVSCAFEPCCPLLGMFGTAKPRIMCTLLVAAVRVCEMGKYHCGFFLGNHRKSTISWLTVALCPLVV